MKYYVWFYIFAILNQLLQSMLHILVFILFLLPVTLSEIYIYRKNIAAYPHRKIKPIYTSITIGLWSATILFWIAIKIFPNAPAGFMHAYGVLALVFLFNGVAKVIFAALTWIGRKVHRLSFFYSLSAVIIIITNCIMTYGATTGRWAIREERADIVSAKVPTSFDGFRIVVFSDAHIGRLLDKYRIMQNLVDAINELDADIVVNAGDLVNNDYGEITPRMEEILSSISSRYGVYSVPGNHDKGKYITKRGLGEDENIAELAEIHARIGWEFLMNETAMVDNGRDTIFITGLDFPQEQMKKRTSSHTRLRGDQGYEAILSEVPADRFGITVSHTPRAWEQLLEAGKSDLTISGHLHSFQMKVILGEQHKWSPARLFYKEWSGLYERDDNYLYINDGIGYAFLPMRIWCKPELTVIELRRDEDNYICGDDK